MTATTTNSSRIRSSYAWVYRACLASNPIFSVQPADGSRQIACPAGKTMHFANLAEKKKQNHQKQLFSRPTPSWVSPGRSTCSIARRKNTIN